MIDLSNLYAKDPSLAPRIAKNTKKNRKISQYVGDKCLKFQNPFRTKLLINIEKHRSRNSLSMSKKSPNKNQRNSLDFSKISIRSSFDSPLKIEKTDAYFRTKLINEPKVEDLETKHLIMQENSEYKKEIIGKLKYAMPSFIESNKKKVARSLSFRDEIN